MLASEIAVDPRRTPWPIEPWPVACQIAIGTDDVEVGDRAVCGRRARVAQETPLKIINVYI